MLEEPRRGLALAHVEPVRTEPPEVRRPVLGHDLIQHLGGRAVFAGADQVRISVMLNTQIA